MYRQMFDIIMLLILQADLNNMTILELRANKLQTYLEDATDITDYMDIIFISRIVQALASRPEVRY